jgi:hypothetical protein
VSRIQKGVLIHKKDLRFPRNKIKSKIQFFIRIPLYLRGIPKSKTMKYALAHPMRFLFVLAFQFIFSFSSNAQMVPATSQTVPANGDTFGSRVRYGGGLSLSFGNDAFLIGVSPQAIYQVNDILAVGAGLSYTYSKFGETKINAVGGSLLALANPIAALQLSAEFEELYIDRDALFFSDNYWVSALYLGVGYGIGPVTVGIRYDVLHDDSKSLYSDPWLPFVRVYF